MENPKCLLPILAALTLATISNCGVLNAATINTANPKATQKAKDVLNYLNNLEGQSVSGHYIGLSDSAFIEQFNSVGTTTGEYPAIMGSDYCAGWNTAEPGTDVIQFDLANEHLKTHWKAGGLVTVMHHLYSPNDPNSGTFRGPIRNFADLLDHNSAAYKVYMAQMDKVALGLQDLSDSGVVVLYRPFHEFSHKGFWWCDQDSSTFIKVWQELFDYFTNTKGLNNLLWVWNPYVQTPAIDKYPGDAYVDIISTDAYMDYPEYNNLLVSTYNKLTSFKPNKPFIMAEIGPETKGVDVDYQRWAVALSEKMPKSRAFLAWQGPCSPMSNLNATAFMQDPWQINRGQLTVMAGTGRNHVQNGGFETGTTSSWTVSNSNVVSTGQVDGNHAIECHTAGGGFQQTVTGLKPNTTYTLGGSLRLVNGTEDANLYVKSYGGSEISQAISGKIYKRINIAFTTGASDTSCVIGVSFNSGTGGVYGDDFIVADGTAAVSIQPPLEFANGGFELGANTHWWFSANTSLISSGQHSGNYGLMVSGKRQGCSQVIYGLQPHTTYTVSCYGHVTEEKDLLSLFVTNYGGKQVNRNIKSHADYEQYSVTFTTGDENSTGSAEIGVWFSKGSGAGYADDFTINVGGPPPGPGGESGLESQKKKKGGKKGAKQKGKDAKGPEE